MGTSQSNPGSSGKSPLLPPWVDPDEGLNVPGDPSSDPPDQDGDDNEEAEKDDEKKPPLGDIQEPQRFKPYRQQLGNFVQSGETAHLKKALGNYSRSASGGGRVASQRLSKAHTVGANLISFLSGSTPSAQSHLADTSLKELEGLPCEQAIGKIVDAIQPEGGDSEKIRVALNEALTEALEGIDNFDPEQITDDVLFKTLWAYISQCVFIYMVSDSAKAFTKSDNSLQALQAENDLMELIKIIVDEKLLPKVSDGLSSFNISDTKDIQKEVIQEVWREWETYE